MRSDFVLALSLLALKHTEPFTVTMEENRKSKNNFLFDRSHTKPWRNEEPCKDHIKLVGR